MPRPPKRSPVQLFLLWILTFAGGALAGMGVFVVAQVRVVRYMRDQVYQLNVFDRLMGKITFLWRGLDEKIALAMGSIPEEYLEHSHDVGVLLATFGLAGVAIILPWTLRERWR